MLFVQRILRVSNDCTMSFQKNIYLLDIPTQNEIIGNKLPSKKQVLSNFFFYQLNVLKKRNKDSARVTVDALKPVWEKSRIPTCPDDQIAEKILWYYAMWKSMCRGSYRKIPISNSKRITF